MLPSLSPKLRALAAWGIILAAVAAIVWMTSRGLRRAPAQITDFYDFLWAAQAVRDGKDISTSGEGGYLYPPLLAVLMQPFTWLGTEFAARLWVYLMAVLAVVSAWLSSRTTAGRVSADIPPLEVCSCAAFGFLLLADNFRAEAEWANCNNLIIALIVGAFACAGRRPAVCGALLGAAAALKYTPIIFLAYFLARCRFREAAWMFAALVALLLAPALVMGWHENLAALAKASGGIATMLGAAPVATGAPDFNPLDAGFSWSIPSGMARIATHRHESRAAWVVGGCAVAAVALVLTAWASYRRVGLAFWRRDARADDVQSPLLVMLELTATLALMVAVSPQTIKRHFNYLLPFTVLMAIIIAVRPGPARWWCVGALAVLWLFAAPMANIPAFRPFLDGTWKWMGGPGFAVVAACGLAMVGVTAFFRSGRRASR